MKNQFGILFFGLTVLTLVSLMLQTTTVRALDFSPLSESHLARIRANCVSAKASLSQLHRSDGRLRVNRGKAYEYIGSELMSHLNSRLVLNRYDPVKFIDATNQFDKELKIFREQSFKDYESSLSATLRIDCTKQPEEFYHKVIETRQKRAIVHDNIKRLHGAMKEYQDVLNQFVAKHKKEAVNG